MQYIPLILHFGEKGVTEMVKPKRQSPDDMLIAVMRAVSRGPEIGTAEFANAAKKVGRTGKERLSWAIKFAQEPIENMTPGDFYNASIESGAFLHRDLAFAQKENKSLPFSQALFPRPEQIKEIKEKFLFLIRGAAVETGYTFAASQMKIAIGPGGISYDIAFNLSDAEKHTKAQVESAMLKLAQLIGEHWGYIGLCDRKRHGCGRYFVKNRTDQQFCTKTCLNRSTTYRQRGKEPVA
jgi:hypothetical protein